MISTVRLVAVTCLCILATACSQNKIHLIGEEDARKGDIQISGTTGAADWTWGTQKYNKHIEVVKDNLTAAGTAIGGGGLTLKLEDGAILELISQQNVFVCNRGCEEEHLPMLWHLVK